MKQRIDNLIKEFLKYINIDQAVNYTIEYPKQAQFGDYSTNLAMVLAKRLKKKPFDIANDFVEFAKNNNDFKDIKIAGAGFINFFINPKTIFEHIVKINSDTLGYFKPNLPKQRVQIEFVSANPTGPLHIGHGRGAAIGDSISRILKFADFNVEKEYYINDAGLQMRMLGLSTFIRYKQLLGIDEKLPDDGYQGEYLVDIAKDIMYEYGDALLNKSEDESVMICQDRAADVILREIVSTLSKFRIKFDVFFNEKRLYDSKEVENAIDFLNQKGFIYEKDSALWFKTTAFGDDKDRVLKKSNGQYTYFASDIAYHKNKFIERNFDIVVDIWGADHHGYVNRMKSAIEALGLDRDRLQVILVQIVNLLRGGEKVSMSTRRAQFVELDDVINEVGVDAARFMFLSRSVDSHLDFDLELAKKQSSENPVYYAQYAYARIRNIFAQLNKQYCFDDIDLNTLSAQEEIELAKSLLRFKEHIRKSIIDLEPYYITNGILDIAEKLHRFYNHIRVIGTKEVKERLFLLESVANTLKLGFDLIGIEAKEKM